MDLSRTQRYGRAGYRANYIPSNVRQAMDARLHPPGLSTSSNSSWTFSNSHDLPKPRKGRLCGIFLIGAVLVVALSVIAIGGLAFYIGGYSMEKHQVSEYQAKESIGAKRQYSTIDYTRKSSSKYSNKTSSPMTSTTTSTTEEPVKSSPAENKRIPPGAILGISKTMQQLNKGLMSRKGGNEGEEEGAIDVELEEVQESTELPTESYESSTYETVSITKEPIRSVVITKDVEILPKDSEPGDGDGEVILVDVEEESELKKEQGFRDRVGEDSVEITQNGHARPTIGNYPSMETVASTGPVSKTPQVNLFPPKRDYSDEPWRPIIPSYREPIRVRNPYLEQYPPKVFEHRYGPPIIPFVNVENDEENIGDVTGPVTFSQDSFNKNLRITPEYVGGGDSLLKSEKNSTMSSEIAAKFKDLLKEKSPEMENLEIVTDDVITAPPVQSSDVLVASDGRVLTASAAFPQPDKTVELKKTIYPIGANQVVPTSGEVATEPKSTSRSSSAPTTAAAVISSSSTTTATTASLVTPSSTITPFSSVAKTTSRIDVKTTPKAATIRTVLKIAGIGNPVHQATMKIQAEKEFTTVSTPTKTSFTTTTSLPTTTVNPAKASSTSNPSATLETTTRFQQNTTIINPFLDDSRSSSSSFNFGLPDFPMIKQFHGFDGLFKSFSRPSGSDSGHFETRAQPPINQYSKYHPRREFDNETTVTRFPVRTKQTTVKSYRDDGESIYVEVSTITPDRATRRITTRKSVVIRGDVQVVTGSLLQDPKPTTEIPKLITLLPVRSNVNMMRPLRPRPKSNVETSGTGRNAKMSVDFKAETPGSGVSSSRKHHFVQDKNGKVWVYYPSYKPTEAPLVSDQRKLHIVTPEPKVTADRKSVTDDDRFFNFTGNLTDVPVYNAIENLLNSDHRKRQEGAGSEKPPEINAGKSKKNTSEIVDRIVKIMENIAIATDDSPEAIIKVNQTVMNKTTTYSMVGNSTANVSEATGIPAKIFSSHYKLNHAGVPVLTKVLNKVPGLRVVDGNVTKREDSTTTTTTTTTRTTFLTPSKGAAKTPSMTTTTPASTTFAFRCSNSSLCNTNYSCMVGEKKCNQVVDCPDASDEKNCTCADHLKVQKLHRKLCDGIVDCWDFTDEYNCEWCKDEFLCSNSKMCIKKTQICDGINDCPFGDDERNCVTISPSLSDAETFNYHNNGYLMVRKKGRWGKLCIDNFDSVSLKSKTGWKISDLGRSVCKALTFRDFDKVERMISVPNEGRSIEGDEKYYELAYNDRSNGNHTARDSVLTFHEADCHKKEVIKVTCTDLECGLRPQATSQWPRIVGGGNAGPGSWPWQAALYREGEFQCGGTLISEHWLISAGHCFFRQQESYWVARLGTLRTTLFLPSPYEQLRHISKIIIHPQYVDRGFINDISLLRMRDPVKLTDYVRPICLPKPQTSIVDGAMCTIVGWGQLSEVGWVFPDTLQEVQLPILSTSECRKRTLFISLYKITDDMFCAGYERGGRDACLGDSGGPLMCTEPDGRWTLYGITSNGYGCARSNRPGVYTKVSKYLTWVHSEIKSHVESATESYKSNLNKTIFGTKNPISDRVKPPSTPLTTSTLFSSSSSPPPLLHSLSTTVSNTSLENVTKIKTALNSLKNTGDTCSGHRCPLGECLPKSKVCNGRIECSDGSDEKDCW